MVAGKKFSAGLFTVSTAILSLATASAFSFGSKQVQTTQTPDLVPQSEIDEHWDVPSFTNLINPEPSAAMPIADFGVSEEQIGYGGQRIVSDPDAFPYFMHGQGFSGSVPDPRVGLTAAHVVEDLNRETGLTEPIGFVEPVRVGGLTKDDPNAQERNVQFVGVLSPGLNAQSPEYPNGGADIAFLQFDAEVATPTVEIVEPGKQLEGPTVLVGAGQNCADPTEDGCHNLDGTVYSYEPPVRPKPLSENPNNIKSSFHVGPSQQREICFGDSGGPGVTDGIQNYTVAGVRHAPDADEPCEDQYIVTDLSQFPVTQELVKFATTHLYQVTIEHKLGIKTGDDETDQRSGMLYITPHCSTVNGETRVYANLELVVMNTAGGVASRKGWLVECGEPKEVYYGHEQHANRSVTVKLGNQVVVNNLPIRAHPLVALGSFPNVVFPEGVPLGGTGGSYSFAANVSVPHVPSNVTRARGLGSVGARTLALN